LHISAAFRIGGSHRFLFCAVLSDLCNSSLRFQRNIKKQKIEIARLVAALGYHLVKADA
jgi:hypothetical protein